MSTHFHKHPTMLPTTALVWQRTPSPRPAARPRLHLDSAACPPEQRGVPLPQDPIQHPANGIGDREGHVHQQLHKRRCSGADL